MSGLESDIEKTKLLTHHFEVVSRFSDAVSGKGREKFRYLFYITSVSHRKWKDLVIWRLIWLYEDSLCKWSLMGILGSCIFGMRRKVHLGLAILVEGGLLDEFSSVNALWELLNTVQVLSGTAEGKTRVVWGREFGFCEVFLFYLLCCVLWGICDFCVFNFWKTFSEADLERSFVAWVIVFLWRDELKMPSTATVILLFRQALTSKCVSFQLWTWIL